MLRELIGAGFQLSGRSDPRLVRGLWLSVLEGIAGALPYVLLHALLTQVLGGSADTRTLALLGLGMLLSLGLRMALGLAAMPRIFGGAYAVMGEARLRVADRLRQLPMGWFTRIRAGELGARLTSDLELIENLWSHFLGISVSNLATAACLLVFLARADLRLCLLVLASLLLSTVAWAVVQRVSAHEAPRLQAAEALLQAETLDYVQGMAVIRSFGRLGPAWQRLCSAIDGQHAAALAIEVRPAPWAAAFGFGLEGGFALLMLLGGYLVIHGTLEAVSLIAFLVVALPLHRLVFDLGIATTLLRYARRAMTRTEAILAEPVQAEPVSSREPDGHDIVLDQVGFSHERTEVEHATLQGVSCAFAAGRLSAIVGPSGAGKSTLLQLMARLWDVDEGAIRLGGVDLREIRTDALHRHVSMVFQEVVLFSGTVLENIRIGRPDANREAVEAAARRAQADAFIRRLPQGYDTLLTEGGASLSGGERQRISIARALLQDAPVLLLDEATASVDPSAEAQLQRALSELVEGRTVVVIAHRLRSVRDADQIVVMDQGRVVEQGRHDGLLAQRGLYARLWECEQAGSAWQARS